jgi:hypothetical protein
MVCKTAFQRTCLSLSEFPIFELPRRGARTHAVVGLGELGSPKLEGKVADDVRDDHRELEVGELLSDTPMPTRSKGLVGRFGALGDLAETVIDLLGRRARVRLLGGGGDTRLVEPSVGVPRRGLLPHARVHRGHAGRSEDEVAGRDDVVGRLGGGRERGWDRDVGQDLAVDRAGMSGMGVKLF